jgi:S1-C subfamily serine protease
MKRKILYVSEAHDICFLEPMGSKSFTLASNVHCGEQVTIIGHPRGIEQSLSDGRIVGERITSLPWLDKAGPIKVYLSTAISYPGNSGSPVVNRYGNVVGILFAGLSLDYLNVNLVVPVEYIVSELESFKNSYNK